MSIKGKLRMLFLYLPLLAGALSGVPMRPEDMEKLNDAMHQDTIECVMPDDEPENDETRAKIRRMMESLAQSDGAPWGYSVLARFWARAGPGRPALRQEKA